MNLNYFFTKTNLFRKLMFWFIVIVLIGLFAILLKQEYNSLYPAAKRMFDAISVVK